jgi:hypothetical protein
MRKFGTLRSRLISTSIQGARIRGNEFYRTARAPILSLDQWCMGRFFRPANLDNDPQPPSAVKK